MAEVLMKTPAGSLLFQEGDESDGMYIIKKGHIEVFLIRDGEEIQLRILSPGEMLGELALFDHKPRSASARAIEESELAFVSAKDFEKVMKSIPKWFVALMTTVSSRLRDSSHFLQDLEQKVKLMQNPLEEMQKKLTMLNLVGYKWGQKHAKGWTADYNLIKEQLLIILDTNEDQLGEIFSVLIEAGFCTKTVTEKGQVLLSLVQRREMERLCQITADLCRVQIGIKNLAVQVGDLIETLHRRVLQSPYESLTINLRDLQTSARQEGLKTESWDRVAESMMRLDEALVIKRNGPDLVIKVSRKKIGQLADFAKTLTKLLSSSVPIEMAA